MKKEQKFYDDLYNELTDLDEKNRTKIVNKYKKIILDKKNKAMEHCLYKY